jgi:hypothetical protein
MAAWLRAIVKGDELAFTDGGGREQAAGGQDVPGTKGSSDASATDKKEKLPMTEQGTMGAKLVRVRVSVRIPTAIYMSIYSCCSFGFELFFNWHLRFSRNFLKHCPFVTLWF